MKFLGKRHWREGTLFTYSLSLDTVNTTHGLWQQQHHQQHQHHHPQKRKIQWEREKKDRLCWENAQTKNMRWLRQSQLHNDRIFITQYILRNKMFIVYECWISKREDFKFMIIEWHTHELSNRGKSDYGAEQTTQLIVVRFLVAIDISASFCDFVDYHYLSRSISLLRQCSLCVSMTNTIFVDTMKKM